MNADGVIGLFADVFLRGSLMLVLAGLVVVLWRNTSASFRCAVWLAAFSGVLMIGPLVLLGPRINLGIVDGPPLIAAQHSAVAGDLAAERGDLRPPTSPQPTSIAWGWLLIVAWASGTSTVLVRFLAGLAGVRRLARRAESAPAEMTRLLAGLASRTGLRRPPQLVVAKTDMTPFAWGLWRPTIVLPESALSWTQDRLSMVLAHELAHIRRWDSCQLMVFNLVCAMHWFNPLVWICRRALIREREVACDDHVIRMQRCPHDYAAELLAIVRTQRTPAGLVVPGIARRSQLEGRVLAILDKNANRRPMTRRALLPLALVSLLVLSTAAMVSPWPDDPRHPRAAIQQKHWMAYSQSDRSAMSAADVDPAYLHGLLAAGYSNLRAWQVIDLKASGIEPLSVIQLQRGAPAKLEAIGDGQDVCMAADAVLSQDRSVEIRIAGSTYRAMPNCTLLLAKNPSMRVARDPLTGERVDKARAVLARYPNGRIAYFANLNHLQRFNAAIR